jgi:hypothetical protein
MSISVINILTQVAVMLSVVEKKKMAQVVNQAVKRF